MTLDKITISPSLPRPVTIELQSQWIKVTDRLPPLEHQVLAWDGRTIEKAFRIKNFDTIIWTYYDFEEWYDVSHWMELPPSPKD